MQNNATELFIVAMSGPFSERKFSLCNSPTPSSGTARRHKHMESSFSSSLSLQLSMSPFCARPRWDGLQQQRLQRRLWYRSTIARRAVCTITMHLFMYSNTSGLSSAEFGFYWLKSKPRFSWTSKWALTSCFRYIAIFLPVLERMERSDCYEI